MTIPSKSKTSGWMVWIAALVAVSATLSACSSTNNPGNDAAVVTEGGVTLWPCDTVNRACNAHNSCAIDPICREDNLCVPSGFVDCSDDLACTDDICDGPGQCKNVPKNGTCALQVKVNGKNERKCFKADDRNPDNACQICDPTKDKFNWSGANGGACDDKNNCTKDDYCQAGRCTGTFFGDDCSDDVDCTDDLCDGKGGCLGNPLKSNACFITGKCYLDGEKHPAGTCFVCTPSSNQNDWAPISDGCTIAGKCYRNGEKDLTGCGVCDPASSASQFTIKGDNCIIGDTCYQAKAQDARQCATCEPDQSKTAWTPLPTKCDIVGTCYDDKYKDASGCLSCAVATSKSDWTTTTGVNTFGYNFEANAAPGWTFTAASSTVKWQVSTRRAAQGTSALYYGDPEKGNFTTGSVANSGKAVAPLMALTAGKGAALRFKLYMDVYNGDTQDILTVRVIDGATVTDVWKKSKVTVPTMKVWQDVVIDLSAYAGKQIQIEFFFDTINSLVNSTEGVFLDDVAIHHACTKP